MGAVPDPTDGTLFRNDLLLLSVSTRSTTTPKYQRVPGEEFRSRARTSCESDIPTVPCVRTTARPTAFPRRDPKPGMGSALHAADQGRRRLVNCPPERRRPAGVVRRRIRATHRYGHRAQRRGLRHHLHRGVSQKHQSRGDRNEADDPEDARSACTDRNDRQTTVEGTSGHGRIRCGPPFWVRYREPRR